MQVDEWSIIIDTDCVVLFNSTMYSFLYNDNTYYRYSFTDRWHNSIRWYDDIFKKQSSFQYLSGIGWYSYIDWHWKKGTEPDIEKEFKKQLSCS